MADRYWVGGTGTWNDTNTTNWSASSGGPGGASVPTFADNVFFDSGSSVGTGAFTVTTGVSTRFCANLTVSGLSGAMTLAGTIGITVRNSISLTSTNFTMTLTGTLTFDGTTSNTITTGGAIITAPVVFNGTGGTWTLQDAMTTTSSVTLTTGTLALSSYTLTSRSFASASSSSRTLAFNTGAITVNGTGTVWNVSGSNFSATGTAQNVTVANGTATATTVTNTILNLQTISFSFTTGSYTLALTDASYFNNLNFTGFSGTISLGSTFSRVYGNLTLGTATNSTSSGGFNNLNFEGTGTSTITSNGRTVGFGIQLNSTTRTILFADTFSQPTNQYLSLTNGTLDMNSQSVTAGIVVIATGTKTIANGTLRCSSVSHNSGDIATSSTATITCTGTYGFNAGSISIADGTVLTAQSWSSSNSSTRSIAFNTSGEIRLTGASNVWNMATITNFSYTGTSRININNTGSVATSIITGSASAAQAMNFFITSGTYTLTLVNGGVYNNLDFTGFSGTYAQAATACTLYGNLVLSPAMSSSTTTGSLTMAATSGTKTITSNGDIINFTLVFNGSGAVFQLADNFTQNTGLFSVVNGTVDLNNKSYSLGNLVFASGTGTLINYGSTIINALLITQQRALTVGSGGYDISFLGTYVLDSGTLTISNGYSLNVGAFSSDSTLTRAIAFGSGSSIVISGSGSNVFNMGTSTITGFSYTGTSNIQLTYSGSIATSISTGIATEAQALDFYITAGTYTITFGGNSSFGILNFTGFSGGFGQSNLVSTVYKDLILSGTMTVAGGGPTGYLRMAATSGTRTITTNGISLNMNIMFNGVGGTFQISDSYSQTSNAYTYFRNGTVDFNNKSYTIGVLDIGIASGSYINYGGNLTAAAINHTSGTVTVGTGALLTSTGAYTWTTGTINLNNGETLNVGSFVSSNVNTRVINFSANSKIQINGSGTAINLATVTGFSFTGTSSIVVNNATSTAATITLSASATSAMNVRVISGTYTLTLTTGNTFRTLNFTGFSGLLSLGTSTHTIVGDLTLGASMTTSGTAGTGHFAFTQTSGTRIITTNGVTANFGISMNGAGQTLALGSALVQASGQVFNYIAGTFDLAGYSTSMGTFVVLTGTHAIVNGTVNCTLVTHTSGNLAIGTGYNLVASGTYTFTAGSITLNDGASLTVGAFSSSNSNARSVAFGTLGSTITVTGAGTSWNLATATNFTYSGTPVANMTYAGASTMTVTSPLTAISFNFTAGTYTLIITNGAIIQNLNFTGFAGTYAQSTANITVLGDLTFGANMSASTSTGVLTMTPPASTARNISTVDVTNITTFVNITINAVAAGSSVKIASSQVVVNNVVLTVGTLDLNNNRLALFSFSSSNSNTRTVVYGTTGEIYMFGSGTVWNTNTPTNFSFTGTSNNNLATAVVASCTLTPGPLSSTQAMNFKVSGSSITVTTTTGGVYRNLDFTGFTGTWAQAATTITILGNLTFGSTMVITSTTGVATMAPPAGTTAILSQAGTAINNNTVANITINAPSATVQLGGTVRIATMATVLTAGTLDLNDRTFIPNTFATSSNLARTIAFGTSGRIQLWGTGTIWNSAIVTNFSYTGTSRVEVLTNTTVAITVNTGAMSAVQALNFYVISAAAITLTTATGSTFDTLDLSSMSAGTWAQAATNITVYENLILSSTMASSTTTGTVTLAGTADSLLTTNGVTHSIRMAISKTGAAKVTLGSAYTSTAVTDVLTHISGTFDTADYTVTIPTFTSTGAGTRTLNLGSSTIILSGSGSTVWNVDAALTLDAGTSTIRMTSTLPKTFIGAGESYHNLQQGGSGTLTVTGSNSFNDITSTSRPSTISLTAGSTQTVANFTLSGTAGNLMTLNSTAAGSPATLSKSSGTVSVSYLTLVDSTATGGAIWNAYTSDGNVDGGGNSGWNFISAVVAAVGAFFAFF